VKRAAVLYNPVAGAGFAARQARRAKSLLAEDGWTVELLATQEPGGAEALARSLADRVELLVVAGGDGSIREAMTGLGDATRRVTVGVLPCGNANVVARELGIPLDAEGSLAVLRSGRPRPIDLGRLGSELFLAIVGVGWDARTVHLLDRLRHTRLGRAWYRWWADSAWFVAGLLAMLLPRRGERFEVHSDGSPGPRAYRAALVANFRCYGKGWSMVPDAGCSSGRLHFQARKRGGPLFVAWALVAAMLRRRTPAFISDHGAGARVVVRSELPFLVQVDGDPRAATTELEVRIDPAAASLLAPEL